MTLRLNDYAEKLEITKTILTRISHHSKNFPKFIPFAMHGELRETHSDEFSKAEINKFIEHEKRADYIIKGHSLPENQRNYFKNATYKNSCIYPEGWIELLNLKKCICNKCLAEPEYISVFDTNTGEFLGEEVIEQTKHYYALRPFQTACILYHKIIELYNEYSPDYDLSRLPLPTKYDLSVSKMQDVISDMVVHCQQGKILIDNKLINKIEPIVKQPTDPLAKYLNDVNSGKIKPLCTPPAPNGQTWSNLDLDILSSLFGEFHTHKELCDKICPYRDIQGKSEEAIRDALKTDNLLRTSGIVDNKRKSGYFRIDAKPNLNDEKTL